MVFLRNGGSAVDGVEMALKSLEDNEITNSGYGSNLSLDGTVECDASIMEESGRSGAVGAVDRKYTLFLLTCGYINHLYNTSFIKQASKILRPSPDSSSIIPAVRCPSSVFHLSCWSGQVRIHMQRNIDSHLSIMKALSAVMLILVG